MADYTESGGEITKPEQGGGFFGFLLGKNHCGVDPSGVPQKPSAFAWFWLLIMIVGLVVNIVGTFRTGSVPDRSCQKSGKVSKGTYTAVAAVGIGVCLLNVLIFYLHASKCCA
jgi:hypothetical protein